MTARAALAWYRAVYALSIAYLSVETMLGAHGVRDHHLWIGGIEALAALLLLVRRVQVPALAALLAIYALVAVVNIASGHVPAYLVIYAASALLIVQLDRGVAEPAR